MKLIFGTEMNYPNDFINKIICGDAIEQLKSIPYNSVDSIVTDPPAGISFMGKKWDDDKGGRDQWIKWLSDVMKEGLRVLKPGGHALVWSLPRTSHWTGMALENAGFEIRDCVYFLFGSGFPKSMDISKQIDKKNHKPRRNLELEGYLSDKIKNKYDTHIQLAVEMDVAESLIRHWIGKCGSQFLIPPLAQYKLLKTKLNLDNRFDWLIEWEEAKREIIGKQDYTAPVELYNVGEDKNGIRTDINITTPSLMEAKQWSGWGTALKPAVECWWLVRKPLSEDTVAENVLKWNVGGLNIDNCRVPTEDNDNWYNSNYPHKTTGYNASSYKIDYQRDSMSNTNGRFPANLIHDGSDEVMAEFAKFGESKSPSTVCKSIITENNRWKDRKGMASVGHETIWQGKGDSGTPARFFYCAKPSRAERDKGLQGMKCNPIPYSDYHENFDTTKSYVSHYPDGTPRPMNKGKNNHPTVKAQALMEYLIKLITPPNGIVLDMFAGSGSTLIAAKKLGHPYIGIEIDTEYCEIAEQRLGIILNNPSLYVRNTIPIINNNLYEKIKQHTITNIYEV